MVFMLPVSDMMFALKTFRLSVRNRKGNLVHVAGPTT
jgi:hypothetical protein